MTKIVKFQDGTFGVRRFSLLCLSYEFFCWKYDTWLPNIEKYHDRIHMTEGMAQSRYESLKAPEPKIDNGRPVKKKTLVPPLGGAPRRCTCRH